MNKQSGYSAGPFTLDEIKFIQIADTKVLAAVARGEIDLNRVAREELANRGLGLHGSGLDSRMPETSTGWTTRGDTTMARFGAKVEEPRVTCPACGNTEKTSSYNVDNKMCSRCWNYLSPEVGGTDHGVFMVRGQTRDDGRRSAEIRPRGFWSACIEVREMTDISYNDDTHEVIKKIRVEVSWGSGGTDGTHDEILPGQFKSYAENFANAMDHAVNLAKLWKMERQEKKEA